ncbi:MAG: type II toxin-antitoxin system RelE family toxin [Vicinamibacteria bacterium]
MAWAIEFDPAAFKELSRLDNPIQRRILRYLRQRLSTEEDPHRFGKALHGEKAGLWRYRVGDHRIVCAIDDERLRVRVLRIGHRRSVYDD